MSKKEILKPCWNTWLLDSFFCSWNQHSIATLITPSLLFSNKSYPWAILLRGYVCVIKGSVLILPCAINCKVFSQSQPSTPPVLKIKFFPYMSGSGKTCGSSYKATIVTIAFGLAHCHASWKVEGTPATSRTTSAPPWSLFSSTKFLHSSGVTVKTSG